MDLAKYYLLLMCVVHGVTPRPHQINILAGEQVGAADSAMMSTTLQSLDIASLGFLDNFSTVGSRVVPVLTFGVISYLAYAASAMFLPGVLTSLGVPVLEDFSPNRLKRSSVNTAPPNFLTSLAGDFMTDVFSRTEVAESMKDTGRSVLSNSTNIVRNITRRIDNQLSVAQGFINRAITALNPGCLSRFMCRAGQFTNLHFPAVGAMLRSIDSRNFDDHALALIDGTTLGDCKSVFHECPL